MSILLPNILRGKKAETMKHQLSNLSRAALFLFVIGASWAAGTAALWGDPSPGLTAKLNGGYFLLHQLSEDEAQLPLLLLVKHAPDEISTYADQISRTAKETLATLDRLQKGDPSIRFDRNPLPPIEQETRASIKADKQHQLLFGTSNSEFVRALLLAQIEACTYGLHLSKVLSEQETDPDRAKALKHLSAKWLAQRSEAFRILRDY